MIKDQTKGKIKRKIKGKIQGKIKGKIKHRNDEIHSIFGKNTVSLQWTALEEVQGD